MTRSGEGAGGDETRDALMRGRFAVIQSAKGHRAGLDALLLAATVPESAAGRLVDLGAGCGTVAFAALTRAKRLEASAVESDAEDCDRMARALDLAANRHLRGRVTVLNDDVAEMRVDPADYVLANPPYNDAALQVSPDGGRRRAHAGGAGTLRLWVAAAARIARPGATIAFILRASAWTDAGASFGERDLGDVRLLPIRPRDAEAASRIIVLARKARRTAPSILPTLTIHEADGRFTPRVAAILDGAAGLFDGKGRPL